MVFSFMSKKKNGLEFIELPSSYCLSLHSLQVYFYFIENWGYKMQYKVLKKQHNSHMCFVCGIHNDLGLNTKYYELEGKKLLGVFHGEDEHQGWPKRMHGGITAALLDETIGRAMQIDDPDLWSVTVELNVKYLKPVPLESKLYVVGWITSVRRSIITGEGYICDEKQTILATATAKYFKQDVKDIIDGRESLGEEWIYVKDDQSPLFFELPK